MQIKINSVLVSDQYKALKFYTEKLGFIKKAEIPIGEFKWLTVISPEGHDDIELSLEPNNNPAASEYPIALHQQGIPITAFYVMNVHEEYERLKSIGVIFQTEPQDVGSDITAMFDDTCGNLIQIYQIKK
jgi:catechol 2,3-dioxygenase-like lactoylglutathione lyase family enzyme